MICILSKMCMGFGTLKTEIEFYLNYLLALQTSPKYLISVSPFSEKMLFMVAIVSSATLEVGCPHLLQLMMTSKNDGGCPVFDLSKITHPRWSPERIWEN